MIRPDFLTDRPLNKMATLRSLCEAHSLRTTVLPVTDGLPHWIIGKGRLHNTNAHYFNIGLYASAPGESLILMEQEQQALIMLLLAEINGVPAALLSMRTEPGLIGLTNLSTTIQSTPSNYLRKHGGKATPYIEVAADPHAFGRVIYDGYQYDWGNYYLRKAKRFLVVKLNSAVVAPAGYCWVEQQSLRRLLLEDELITNDLRACASLLVRPPVAARVDPNEPARFDTDATLRQLAFSSGCVDTRGTTVSYFRTESETREVSSWIQPLLVPSEPMIIRLVFARRARGRVFAVEERTEPGLLGRRLWFPANATSGNVTQKVATSAEGGRFWKYRIHIELLEAASSGDLDDLAATGVEWMTEEELSALVAAPLRTSLELRLAWSIAHSEERPG